MRIRGVISIAALAAATALSSPASAATLATATTALNLVWPGSAIQRHRRHDRQQPGAHARLHPGQPVVPGRFSRQAGLGLFQVPDHANGRPAAGDCRQHGADRRPGVTYEVPAGTTLETVGSAAARHHRHVSTAPSRRKPNTWSIRRRPCAPTSSSILPSRSMNGEVVVGAGLPEDVALSRCRTPTTTMPTQSGAGAGAAAEPAHRLRLP